MIAGPGIETGLRHRKVARNFRIFNEGSRIGWSFTKDSLLIDWGKSYYIWNLALSYYKIETTTDHLE